MAKKKQVIDPDKIAQTFGIKYKKIKTTVLAPKGEEETTLFYFKLNEKGREKSAFLQLFDDVRNMIWLSIEAKNGYQSRIDFSNITGVKYIPEYKKIVFESHTKTHFSILEVYWRGQFSLFHGWDEKIYTKSAWAKPKKKNTLK